MPSIAVQAVKVNVSAADAHGRVTVDSTAYIYPGTSGNIRNTGTGAVARVKILAVLGTTTILVRRWPSHSEPDGSATYDKQDSGPPSYGVSDMTGWNAAGTLYIEAQTAPVDPAFVKRVVP